MKLGEQSLNGRTHHVYVIYNDFRMLTDQTSLPPNQPTGLKVKNVHYFGIFQPIWMKIGMQSLNGRTHHVYVIYKDFSMLVAGFRDSHYLLRTRMTDAETMSESLICHKDISIYKDVDETS